MDFNLTPEQVQYQQHVRQWVQDHAPGGRDFAEADMGESLEAIRARYAEWQRKRFDAKLTCVMWPAQYGGSGLGVVEHYIVTSEIDTLAVVPNINIIGFGMCLPVVLHAGNDAQRERYLPPAARGEEIWCQLFSEPSGGSDLAALKTRAEPAEGGYRVNGQKIWTSYAQFADYGLLIARTDPAVAKHRGLTMFIVDMRAPGVTVRPIRFSNGAHVFNEVFFEDVFIPAENVVGEVNGGWKVAIDTLMFERGTSNIHLLFRPLLERVVNFAREQLADAAPTLENQKARAQLARLLTRLQIMDLQGLRVLAGVVSGAPPGPEGSLVKLDWSESNRDTQALAMELLGPVGPLLGGSDRVPEGGVFARQWLRSFGNTIEAGSSEILRNIVAERILGLPKDAARSKG